MEKTIEATIRDLEWWVITQPTKSLAVGTILSFEMAKQFPVGATHFCDGSELSIEEFPDLYEVIGDTFGGSEGKFNLPDLRMKLIGMMA